MIADRIETIWVVTLPTYLHTFNSKRFAANYRHQYKLFANSNYIIVLSA